MLYYTQIFDIRFDKTYLYSVIIALPWEFANQGLTRDFLEISPLTYRELDELKVVTQPVKIIHRSDPFETQI